MNLVLSLSAIFSVITVISEAAVIEDKTNRTSEGWLATGRANRIVCKAYDVLFPDGYCKQILGNSPVFGKMEDLRNNHEKLRGFNVLKSSSPQYFVRESCLAAIDDMCCHNYFPRCYISSSPQPICREACEEKFLKVCDQEIKVAKTLNSEQPFSLPFNFEIMNCTTLPYRNQGNCYYPDVIQEQLNILESKECFYGDGRGYHGNKSTTVSGYKCQSWNGTTPREHNITGSIYKEITNCTDFCRNPGGFGLKGPWCFTTNETVQWEYCGVPRCAKEAPSSPPSDFRGHNLSSTSIQVNWEDIPKSSVNGILLGFHVACDLVNCSEGQVMDLPRENHSFVFRGLEKYKKYSCCLRAYNNFGNGSWSKELVISTDEDVPDHPPLDISATTTESAVLLQWNPVPPEYTNGKVLGYKVLYGDVNGTTREKSTVSTRKTFQNIEGLTAHTNYRFQVLAFTAKGDGVASAPYYVKTPAGALPTDTYKHATAITAAVLSGIAVLAGVFLTILYIRKKRRQVERENNDGNDPNALVTPYATSAPDWLERINAPHIYEMVENDHEVDEDVSVICHRVPYINIAPNGSLKLPPYLRNIFLEFERYYENTRYQRLKRGRRFIGWTSEVNDGLLYDTLHRGISVPSVSPNSLSREPAHQTTVEDSRKGLKRHSICLGELRGVREAVQGEFSSTQPVEIDTIGWTTSHNRRRFSVDLGEVREFIAMTEMKSTPTDNPAVTDHWPADMRETHQSEALQC
ncbi:uncharacterized protein [Montipora foliosa]|uniref:uncharacterized protein isoform X1 n=1 Tax=Montipora foliosa TaxID=591990 RepID=UPI0035F2076B